MSQPSPNFSEYRTVGEAAAFLGVTPATLRNWDRNGKLKPRRHPQNGYRIYLHEDLEAVLRLADESLLVDDSFAPAIDWSDMRDNEHFVQFYESDEFLAQSVSGFVGAALSQGQCGIVIATAEHREAIEHGLRELGISPAEAIEQGRFVLLDAAQMLSQFMSDEAPDPNRFNEVIGSVIAKLESGGRRVHAFGEMVALLWTAGQRQAAIALEGLWNELAKEHRFALCCAYPMSGFGDGTDDGPLNGVCKCHSRVIPSESYTEISDPYERLREITHLQQKALALEAEIAHRAEVEKALSHRERELADFFDNATEGLHKVGADGVIIWANQAELSLFGYRREEYVGRHIAEFHVDAEAIQNILQKLSRGESLHNQPARIRCKDGSTRDVLINSNGCFEGGKFSYSRCFTRDVTELKRAERERAKLAAIVDSSIDAIISKNLNGLILSWNAGAERLFGYGADEAIGQPITLLIPPDRFAEEAEILRRLRRGERVEHFETVRLRKDGTPAFISLTISPIRDGDGNIIGASKIARDISERKRIETELRTSEERFRSLTQLLPVGVYTCESQGGTITYFNDKAAEIWGRAPELGDSDECFCGSLKLYLPDGTYLPHDQCPMAVALREGKAFRNEEVIIERPDGTRTTGLVNIDPLRGPNGEVIGAVNVFLDVTALKSAELALRHQKENLQTLLETLPVAVFIAEDPECRRISGNPAAAALLRMSADSNFSKTAPPDERPTHFRTLKQGQAIPSEDLPIQRAVRGETIHSEEVEHEFNDGTTVYTLVAAKPLYDSTGQTRGAVGCMLDVTELKRAEFALREADRRKDEFLATLAHELRNPLAPIRNGLEILKFGAADEQLTNDVRGIMSRQTEHLGRLVDDLLDVSRITRNKIELRKQRVEFADVIKSAWEASRPLIDAGGHQITMSLPTEKVYLDADPTRIAQIFSNLLNNSAKYTESGGRISVRAEVQGKELAVVVEDNGIGISCESIAYVFDMFRQVEGSLERSQGGLGIGLTLVRRLVELHGGKIDARSEGVGKGSAFTVRLPIALTDDSQAGTASIADVASHPKRRILVVDDNRDSVFTLTSLLRIKGNDVECAYDGLEAIEVAAKYLPEIVLMDVGMPKLNGYDATRRIREQPWGRDIFIVALSGWGQPEDLKKSVEAGCSGHLTKPVDFDLLERLLANRQCAPT